MRIVAGELKGRSFVAPAGEDTRPTTDRVREAVFSTLFSQLGGWGGVRVLDLFAGSGAFGFEALSRGAEHAVGVDNGRAAQRAIESNAAALGLGGRYTLVRRDVAQSFAQLSGLGPFDLIFLDPPYALPSGEVAALLSELAERGDIAPGAIVGYEHQRRAGISWPVGFEQLRVKQYGYSAVSYAMYREEGIAGEGTGTSEIPADEYPTEEGGAQ